ncbi:hypothetical protein GALMADRAFT_105145 [Galerina marginata CBS 339.88]|uniref:Nephrocystin 3-like N-terminal domain-containing protein n=1 Tax=Galerina marginata (strain CBS 339.88) TaxID=685588 RepID=A0A067SE89_GALM3|nr:hypothetical protein GALMADRAFT_105145 [Galerina marginata CBS 339.88]
MSTGILSNSSNFVISGGAFTQLVNHYDVKSGFEQLARFALSAGMHDAGGSYDRPRCYENTRVAILQQLMDWLVQDTEKDMLIMWLYGDAGAGKSAIAQTIAESCSQRNLLLGSFFFSGNDASRSTETSLVATLAYQAATAVSGLKENITVAVDTDPMVFQKNLKAQISSLLIDPINIYAVHPDFNLDSFPRVFIIDGLDECTDRGMQCHILETMSVEARRCIVPLKFLFASRQEIEITATFNSKHLQSYSTRLALSASSQASSDIRHFLNGTFREIKATHPQRRYIPDTWPPDDAVEKLVTTASGQFIYASTVARYVSSLRHQPIGRLKVVLGLQATASEKDLPFAELDTLYRRLFSMIDSENRHPVLTVLGLLIFKFRSQNPPFNQVDSINAILSLEPGQLEFYLSDLASILEWKVDEIRITHVSLSDFLLDRQRSKEFHLDEGAFSAKLAQIYLEHLSDIDTTSS